MQRTDIVEQGNTNVEPLNTELESYRTQFAQIKSDAGAFLEGLTEAQFNWRQAPGRWSIGECLSHLNITASLFLPKADEQMSRAREKGLLSHGPFRYGFIGNFIIRTTEPPVKLKVKNPKIFAPVPDQSMAQVSSEFLSLQDELIKRVEAANGIDLARVKLVSPVNKHLKFSLGQMFALTTAHERRHLWQAKQVLAAMK